MIILLLVKDQNFSRKDRNLDDVDGNDGRTYCMSSVRSQSGFSEYSSVMVKSQFVGGSVYDNRWGGHQLLEVYQKALALIKPFVNELNVINYANLKANLPYILNQA